MFEKVTEKIQGVVNEYLELNPLIGLLIIITVFVLFHLGLNDDLIKNRIKKDK